MSLLENRIEFARDLGMLLHFAHANELDIIVDQVRRGRHESEWNATHCRQVIDGKRCERTQQEHGEGWVNWHSFKPIGIANSVHNSGLAADIYVIENGVISDSVQVYDLLGTLWKSLRDENRWGGDFEGFRDLGHFSRTHNGRS